MRLVRAVAIVTVLLSASLAVGSEADRADYLRGFAEGYRESYASSYVSAFNQGMWDGRYEGYNAGFNPTYSALYDEAFGRAQPLGYNRAYGAAFDQGQRLGVAVLEEMQARSSGGLSGRVSGSTGADFTIWADHFGHWSTFGEESPYDLGFGDGQDRGDYQGSTIGYDNGHGVYYSRALELGEADARVQGPLDGARDGRDTGERNGLATGWRDGYVSAFGEAGPPGDRIPLMAQLELPSLDEERFLADVLGGDTLAAIRAGRVQGIDSIRVDELAAYNGTIEVPEVAVPDFAYSRNVTGADFTIWADDFGSYGYDVAYGSWLSVVAVPEPGSCLIAALGMAAVGLIARRRVAA